MTTPTIKPEHYFQIAEHHNQVAETLRAIGDKTAAQAAEHKRDVTINRARAVEATMKQQQS